MFEIYDLLEAGILCVFFVSRGFAVPYLAFFRGLYRPWLVVRAFFLLFGRDGRGIRKYFI